MNIEVEIRSFITKEQYDDLMDFFKKNSEFIKEGNQETFYIDTNLDLRIQKNDFYSKIWMKKGNLHDDHREEIEIKFDKNDFEKLDRIFSELGFGVQIKWFRHRTEFLWNGISVCLDFTRGYGYIIEFEKMSDEANKSVELETLRQKMIELGIVISPKEEFSKKYDFYKKNWKELT